MKRRLIATTLGAALLLSMIAAAPALAAPVLKVEVQRKQATINRGDEGVGYEVKVKNTSATDPTTGALDLFVFMPQGLTLKAAQGNGWSCDLSGPVCSNSAVIAAGGSYPTLELREVWIDESAPDTPTVFIGAAGAGAKGTSASDTFTFGPRLPYGLSSTTGVFEDEAGNEETQAGGHPHTAGTIFRVNQRSGRRVLQSGEQTIYPVDDTLGGAAELWPGVIGNPEAVQATCDFADVQRGICPDQAAVGGVKVYFALGPGEQPGFPTPPENVVYRLPHERGYPASFGFKTLATAFVIRARLRSDGDYGITGLIPNVPASPQVFGSNFVFCNSGVEIGPGVGGPQFEGCKKLSDPSHNPQALITLNTNCAAGKPHTTFYANSWQNPARYTANETPDVTDPNWSILGFESPLLSNCTQLNEEWTSNHEPTFGFQPDGHAADSPAAYVSSLHVPQDGLTDPEGLATSHLKDVTVTLPPGLTFNPAVGHRLEGCSTSQIGLIGTGFPAPNPIHIDAQLPHCPEASKIGTLETTTPVLADPLRGSIFLAAQKDNPFNSNYAIYLSIEEPDTGVIVKLAGKVSPNPRTGQITVTFPNNPQVPVEDLALRFFGGDRSALANPVTCGTFDVRTSFTPWSAADPDHPLASEIAHPTDQIQITSGPHGSPCVFDPAKRPFDVGYEAGSTNPVAGEPSPFQMRITRPDGSQELDRLEISPPPGFVGSLQGIPYCSEAQIKATEAGSGKAEQRSSNCPPAAQLGTVYAGAGPGANPYFAPGKLYLAGPYKGQTLSVVAVTPAVAGPFDLGNVVIRSALKLDPVTARINAITDPIPQVFEGIPLRVRDVRINLDRPGWGQTPTNCEALTSDMSAYGSNGAIAKRSVHYQIRGCAKLGFKPKLSIHLKGGTRRGDHPALVAVLSTRDGDANIARAAVTLPPSAFLDQSHIRTICTRVQFAADACPKGSIYGYGKAVTELLDDPIQGNVILRSSDNKLPDLVAVLKGVANIEAVGRIDSVKGGIRNTFDIVPDAPFDAFTLKMQGGKKGLVVNSQDLCAKTHRATVKLTGQNGKRYNFRPKVIADNCKKRKKAKKGKKRAQKRGHRR